VALIWAAVLLVLISLANLLTYFVVYIQNLPLNNTPIARLVVNYINLLPPDTNIYLVECCWEAGMPEPDSVRHEMMHPEKLEKLDASTLSCVGLDNLLNGPAVIIWSNKLDLPAPSLADCSERFPAQMYSSADGLGVFHAAPVLNVPVRVILPVEATPDPGNPIPANPTSQNINWLGQLVNVEYSVLDIGRIEDAVDGNTETLMRAATANPLLMDFQFSEPLSASVFHVTVATMNSFTVRVFVTYTDGSTEQVNNDYAGLPNDPTVDIELPATDKLIQSLHVEIEDTGPEPGDGYHIHVRELNLE
jgi:hypothetical protein